MAVSVLDAGALTINSFLGTFNLSSPNYHALWERTRLSKDVLYNLSMLRVFVLDEGTTFLFISLPFIFFFFFFFLFLFLQGTDSVLAFSVVSVSMLPQHGLGYLNFCLQQVRNNQEPFGGIQAVFVGDFHQVCPLFSPLKPARIFADSCTPFFYCSFFLVALFHISFLLFGHSVVSSVRHGARPTFAMWSSRLRELR